MYARKPREPRRLVGVKARMQAGQRQSDVVIGNVTARGFMGKCEAPPPKGARVEIKHGEFSISGNVIWSKNRRFGVQSDEAIDVAALVPVVEQERSQRMMRAAAARPNGGNVPQRRKPTTKPKPRGGEKASSWRDPIVAVVVAAVTTTAVETGYLSAAWQALSQYLPISFG